MDTQQQISNVGCKSKQAQRRKSPKGKSRVARISLPLEKAKILQLFSFTEFLNLPELEISSLQSP
jgi:hypothetical protein